MDKKYIDMSNTDEKVITNPQLAFSKAEEIAQSINNDVLRNVCVDVLVNNKDKFISIKGSDWQHHNYAGGLIVHTYNVAKIAVELAKYYDYCLDIDLVKFGALLHDVGKLFDYQAQSSYESNNNMTMNRALLGHVYEGASYVERCLRKEFAKECSSNKQNKDYENYIENVITQCIHCIGCHMMSKIGNIAEQQMLEVIIISHADRIDARMSQTILNDDRIKYQNGSGMTIYRSCLN